MSELRFSGTILSENIKSNCFVTTSQLNRNKRRLTSDEWKHNLNEFRQHQGSREKLASRRERCIYGGPLVSQELHSIKLLHYTDASCYLTNEFRRSAGSSQQPSLHRRRRNLKSCQAEVRVVISSSCYLFLSTVGRAEKKPTRVIFFSGKTPLQRSRQKTVSILTRGGSCWRSRWFQSDAGDSDSAVFNSEMKPREGGKLTSWFARSISQRRHSSTRKLQLLCCTKLWVWRQMDSLNGSIKSEVGLIHYFIAFISCQGDENFGSGGSREDCYTLNTIRKSNMKLT